jgi:integral membrane protein (TIGR00529 family)
MKLGLLQLGQIVFQSVTHLQTASLVMIVGFILVISRLMKDSGHLDRILSTFAQLSQDDRIAGSVMPALIGLLPMPGGALFSAPMVDAALRRNTMAGEAKTAVNYWFRHIWEFWWPLYPAVVLAVALLEVDTWEFMAIMAPMTLVTVLAGIIFILRPLGNMSNQQDSRMSFYGMRGFFWEIMPILVVVFVIMALAGLTALLEHLGFSVEIPGALSVLPGLIVSAIWVCIVNRVSLMQFQSAILDRGMVSMLLLIISIMIFKGVMMDSQAVAQIRDELMAYNIPVVLIIVIMPFVSGFVTGIAIGFVATAFPLIIPLFPSSYNFDYLSYAALAYSFGVMGQMVSPVHLCFLVTKDYFKASLLTSYRHIILPSVTVMASAVIIFFISRTL